MRRSAVLLLLMAGCSTAPVADVMDYFSPGRLDKPQVAPYGGVCQTPGQGPPLNAIPIAGPPPAFPGAGAPTGPPPAAGPGTLPPPPVFPITSPSSANPLIPVQPPPGLQTSPPGSVTGRQFSSGGGASPGVSLSLPSIDTNSPR
jgi:hypothetical protein